MQAELIAYAEALGSLHAWSMGHTSEAARVRARHGPGDGAAPRWRDAVQRGKEPFLATLAALGVASGGVAKEIDQVHRMIIGQAAQRHGLRGNHMEAGPGRGRRDSASSNAFATSSACTWFSTPSP